MTSHQTITTETGDELVVLSRRDFDALLAAAGDEEAERRAAERIAREARGRIDRGEEVVLPDWLAFATARGESPLKAIRGRAGRTQADLARAAGAPQSFISEIEGGRKAMPAALRAKLADALDVDPRWLDPVDA